MNPIWWLISAVIRLSKQSFSNDPKSVADRGGVVRTNPVEIAVGGAAHTIMAIVKVVAIGALVVLGGIVWLVWKQGGLPEPLPQSMQEIQQEQGRYLGPCEPPNNPNNPECIKSIGRTRACLSTFWVQPYACSCMHSQTTLIDEQAT